MMWNTIGFTVVFYLVAALIIFVLSKISPNAHDGGLGFGGLALMILPLVILILAGLNVYWGIREQHYYFIAAGIHIVVLVVLVKRLFM